MVWVLVAWECMPEIVDRHEQALPWDGYSMVKNVSQVHVQVPTEKTSTRVSR